MEIYRLWVKFQTAKIGRLQSGVPADFASGPHAEIRLNLSEMHWSYAPPQDREAAALVSRFFGGSSGSITGSSGGNVTLTCNGLNVGVMDLAMSKRTNLSGVIGTKFEKAGTSMLSVFDPEFITEGLYFTRPPVWADQSTLTKFGILLEHAKKFASNDVRSLIGRLASALPTVVAVMLLLIGLGAAAGGVVAFVVGVLVAGVTLLPRADEYAVQLAIIDDVMTSTSQTVPESELDRGGRAVAVFFGMVIEDCALALAIHAGSRAAGRVRPSKTPEAIETLDQAFSRNEAAFKEGQRKAKARADAKRALPPPPVPERYTAAQLRVAHDYAFRDFRSFVNQPYSALKAELLNQGYVWQKKAIFDGARGGNANAGGSEIWVRRSNPDLSRAELCEVVRVDREGHSQLQSDGPVTARRNPRTGSWEKNQGHGSVGHFHKDVVPIGLLRQYCEGYVPGIKSVSDHGNIVSPGPHMFQEMHIRIINF